MVGQQSTGGVNFGAEKSPEVANRSDLGQGVLELKYTLFTQVILPLSRKEGTTEKDFCLRAKAVFWP